MTSARHVITLLASSVLVLAAAGCGGSDPAPPAAQAGTAPAATAPDAAATATVAPPVDAAAGATSPGTPAAAGGAAAAPAPSPEGAPAASPAQSARQASAGLSPRSKKPRIRRRVVTPEGGNGVRPVPSSRSVAVTPGGSTGGMVAAGAPKQDKHAFTRPKRGDVAQVAPVQAPVYPPAPPAGRSLAATDLAGIALGSTTFAEVRARLPKPLSSRRIDGQRCLRFGALDAISGAPSAGQRWQLCFKADVLVSRAIAPVKPLEPGS